MNIRKAILALAATVALLLAPLAYAQTAHSARPAATTNENISAPQSNAQHNWTTDQIVTATVHQAWVLSGKDEASFFEIVKELAEISAANRNLTLPDNAAAGRRAGAYIKAQAKADHDQLLYAIVDKSVRMTGTKAAATPAGGN